VGVVQKTKKVKCAASSSHGHIRPPTKTLVWTRYAQIWPTKIQTKLMWKRVLVVLMWKKVADMAQMTWPKTWFTTKPKNNK